MAHDVNRSGAKRLRLSTQPLPTLRNAPQQDSDHKVAVVDSPAPPLLEDVVEGEVLELSTQEIDLFPTSPVAQAEASLGQLMLQQNSHTQAVGEDAASPFRSRARAHSESDGAMFDPTTGEPITQCRTPVDPHIYRPGQARYPLLQATVDELAREHDIEHTQSQESVPNPTPKGIPGPSIFSPQTASSPTSIATLPNSGPAASGPQDIIRRSASGSTLQRTLHGRRSSRRSSGRSDMSSTSPASAFLAQLSSSQASPDPDEEGQQIGDQGEYIIGQQIGFGGFSTIKEVFKVENGQKYRLAVKIVRKQAAGKDDLENERFQNEAEHEVSIWRHLKHPNILPLISAFDTPFARYCIMTLTSGGTLLDLVRRYRKAGQAPSDASPGAAVISADKVMPLAMVQKYLLQLARAVRYLHQDVRVVHRDIKLENCLIDESGTLLLCDFGMADFHDADARATPSGRPQSLRGSGTSDSDSDSDSPHGGMGPSETSTSITGSLPSASPELIRACRPLYRPSIDMWAYGVICYALIVGRLPFNHAFAPTLQMMILKGEWNRNAVELAMQTRGEDGASVAAAVSLVNCCLDVNTRQRWTITQVMASKFLRPLP